MALSRKHGLEYVHLLVEAGVYPFSLFDRMAAKRDAYRKVSRPDFPMTIVTAANELYARSLWQLLRSGERTDINVTLR